MAFLELHDQALEMRKLGMSYSKIKTELGVSKSTLSTWLRDYPLSREQINALRGDSEQRIERYRETRARSRLTRQIDTYDSVGEEIGVLSEREIFIAGLFLYWAEGTKASRGSVVMTNTDPKMLKFFLLWLQNQGVNISKIHVRLHLYADMDEKVETEYWSENLGIPISFFRKPYIKESFQNKRKNYKGRFGHGTCNVMLNDTMLNEKIIQGIEFIRNKQEIMAISEN